MGVREEKMIKNSLIVESIVFCFADMNSDTSDGKSNKVITSLKIMTIN